MRHIRLLELLLVGTLVCDGGINVNVLLTVRRGVGMIMCTAILIVNDIVFSLHFITHNDVKQTRINKCSVQR